MPCSRHRVWVLPLKRAGTIPAELGELRALRELRVAHNSLHGVIPDTLGNLMRLRILVMSRNHLEGKCAIAIGAMCRMQEISDK